MSSLFGFRAPQKEEVPAEKPENKFDTDVDGVFADDIVKVGDTKLPVFNVEKEDFFNNLTANRKRIRFSQDSTASNYMRNTKYRNPFFIQFTDEKAGKTYRRKIK